MKLSDHVQLDSLVRERGRLRNSIEAALNDEDIKVQIRGSEAQGPVRQVCITAIAVMYEEQLAANTERLKALGVEADDEPVLPRQKGPRSRMREVEAVGR